MPLEPCSPVSIPQGTIKRRQEYVLLRAGAVFQFHKVRLKGTGETTIKNKRTSFNSTRYD